MTRLFNGESYDQINGVAMGSPLAPVLANLFMEHNEKKRLLSYSGIKPLFYKRYVDDIFLLFEQELDAKNFLNYLNTQHDNIKFTIEFETDKKTFFS